MRPKSGLSNKNAGKLLRIEERVVAAVLDPRAVVDTHDVGVRVAGEGESGERKEPGRYKKTLQHIVRKVKDRRISRS